MSKDKSLMPLDSFGKPTSRELAWSVTGAIQAFAHAKASLKTALFEFEKGTGVKYEVYITWDQATRRAFLKQKEVA